MTHLTPTTNSIEIRRLHWHFKKKQPVLRGVDLALPVGSVTALLGKNGAGKTTLMRALTGGLPFPRGTVSVLGRDPWRERVAVLRSIGHVADQTELPRWMKVREHWDLLAPFYPGWEMSEARRLAERLGVDPDARYHDLSRGGKELACLVAALAHKPKLLLLDEPFSGLDVLARRRVFDALLELLREDGRSALLASHSLADVERCADRIAVLHEGRISLCGEIEELRRGATRLAVELEGDSPSWTPPLPAKVERREGRELVLYTLRDAESLQDQLAHDPAVKHVEPVERDLEDLVAAALGEVAPS
ncbi:MAG: ABC transporter ATP-binding protein [Planctomycetes bacterium]|nr:ABC transporter ATP-binding protein [Planctomycetota bacterium]